MCGTTIIIAALMLAAVRELAYLALAAYLAHLICILGQARLQRPADLADHSAPDDRRMGFPGTNL